MDVSPYRATGTNNPNKQVSVTRWNAVLDIIEANGGPINAKWFGAVGDGATDDTAALQAALDYITETDSDGRELYLDAGTYRVTNLAITAARSITIRGAGRVKTTIRATSTLPALSINGLWFSRIEGLSFDTESALTGKGVVEQDGNYDGSNTQGTQGITWADCWFDGRGQLSGGLSEYAFMMNRQGGSSAQGSECIFLNCHFLGASEALYYQLGYNALANTFLGCNFQVYSKTAIYLNGGTVACYNTGFQSTYGITQYDNDGWDIDCGSSGANEGIIISGCRTESLRFLKGGGANRLSVHGCVGVLAMTSWSASTAYALGAAIQVPSLDKVFVVTTAGTSGGSEPSWPTDGSPIVDGTVTWDELEFNFIDVNVGTVDRFTCGSDAGKIKAPSRHRIERVTAAADVAPADDVVIVDTTSGAVTVTLPTASGASAEVVEPHIITIKKPDTSANAVTISSDVGFENGTGTDTIAGGSRGSKTYCLSTGAAGVVRWHVIAEV